ncbi:hypothetical protein [Herbaspirillum sp. RV1423]|uniref:hypothetical protein n=1 Tax=Herbaspirillum sp. RV1423 TaxID=1443993 RepID=UPI0012DCD2C0|nr:hypothetical protein [Herbaspirillum sp. RV1423]
MMHNRYLKPAARFALLRIVILLVGMTSALFVYQTPTSPADAAEYRIIGEHAYPIQTEESKQHTGELEMYGGNAAVVIASFNRRLHELFRGKNLACILAISSLVLAAGCFAAAWRLKRDD